MRGSSTQRGVYVSADWKGLGGPRLLGTLHSELLRGKEVFSFAYDRAWLQGGFAQMLDPDLDFYSDLHFLKNDRTHFGLFLDSSPDRWGRMLMDRREAATALKAGRAPQNLHETDCLLGVFDGHRMGGLRFKLSLEGPFLDDNVEMAAPPWASIRELEQISLRLEGDDAVDDPDFLKWLGLLVAPGCSLGGARPKASWTSLIF